MIDITDKTHEPTIEEINELISNPLFMEMYKDLNENFKALYSIEYSGDKILLGWNIRFRKAGRSLCRLYPKSGYFSALVVVGCKEKENVEEILPQMTAEMQQIYNSTQEGMGQRWLLPDIKSQEIMNDVMKIVKIRRESK